jgi:hypothetical protein
MSVGSLRWQVLTVDEDRARALVITKEIIAKMPYHQSCEAITWEDCSLREWLNTDFYDSLPASVKARVIKVTNQNPDNSHYGAFGGNPTRDKVFLLSLSEIRACFSNDEARIAKYNGTDNRWLLRSPGGFAFRVAYVYASGGVSAGGVLVNNDSNGVRPALWLNL